MRKAISIILIIMIISSVSFAAPIKGTRIKDQTLTYKTGHYLEGEPIPMGFDIYGYNYQAHLFNGYYCNIYLGGYGFPPYQGNEEEYLAENPTVENKWYWASRNESIVMKWNDAWMSNMDCDDDGMLDRHFGFESYIDSGAWETNHIFWEDEEGEHEYFVKIVAVRSSDELIDDYWYTENGEEIGPSIWGQFAIILETEDDEVLYHSLFKLGVGIW